MWEKNGRFSPTARARSPALAVSSIGACFSLIASPLGVVAAIRATRSRAAVRRVKGLSANPAIRQAVAKIADDPNEKLQEQAIALYSDGKSQAMMTTSARTLDYDFFVARVMPLLATKGRDGNACVDCHATHAILKLNPPDKAGHFTEAQLRENYARLKGQWGAGTYDRWFAKPLNNGQLNTVAAFPLFSFIC